MSSQPQNSAQAESSAQPWLPRLCGPRRAKRPKISADQQLEQQGCAFGCGDKCVLGKRQQISAEELEQQKAQKEAEKLEQQKWQEYCKKLFESDEEQDARDAKKKEEEEKRKAAKGPPEPRRKWALGKSEKEMLEEHERMKSKSE